MPATSRSEEASRICLLGFLTVTVAIDHGVDFLVVVSLVVLALLAFEVLGALTSPPDD